MGISAFLALSEVLASPLPFAALVGLAAFLVWMSVAPARPARAMHDRMQGYLRVGVTVEDVEMRQPFSQRVLTPLLRRALRVLGNLAPKRNVEAMRKLLVQAGEPGGLTVLDFMGVRLLCGIIVGILCFLVLSRLHQPTRVAVIGGLLVGGIAAFLPLYWLRSRVRRRRQEISKALADALDMLTICVEAGLAFESALLKVSQKWNNALTREFQRAVVEMRLGTPRNTALQRIVERSDVEELRMFVAILVQASQLGLSISQVLHSQAAQMRMRRRQRAEEQARQAGIKMLFPLIFLIFPALMLVVLGPTAPTIMQVMTTLTAPR